MSIDLETLCYFFSPPWFLRDKRELEGRIICKILFNVGDGVRCAYISEEAFDALPEDFNKKMMQKVKARLPLKVVDIENVVTIAIFELAGKIKTRNREDGHSDD